MVTKVVQSPKRIIVVPGVNTHGRSFVGATSRAFIVCFGPVAPRSQARSSATTEHMVIVQRLTAGWVVQCGCMVPLPFLRAMAFGSRDAVADAQHANGVPRERYGLRSRPTDQDFARVRARPLRARNGRPARGILRAAQAQQATVSPPPARSPGARAAH